MWITLIVSLECNDLLGNLGSWYSCGCCVEHITHPNTNVDEIHPFMVTVLPDSSDPPSMSMCTDTPQKLHKNGLRNTIKSPSWWPGLQIPQILIWPSICGKCWNKSDPWRAHPPTIQDPKDPLQMCHRRPQRSWGHALTGQSCFGCTILSRWF